MLKFILKKLGSFLILLDRTFAPKAIVRPLEYQRKVDQMTKRFSLYQFEGCPFCIKVRRVFKELNLNIALYNIDEIESAKHDLVHNGGMLQVPCLKIENEDGSVQWMYESSDIIRFLRERFSE